MADQDRFKVNTSDYLGFDYKEFQQEMYSLALSNPSAYQLQRKNVIRQFKVGAVGGLYEVFFNLLSKGEVDDNPVFADVNNVRLTPHYPAQDVSAFALKAARQMEIVIDEAIELLIPHDFNHLAEKRLGDKASTRFIQ